MSNETNTAVAESNLTASIPEVAAAVTPAIATSTQHADTNAFLATIDRINPDYFKNPRSEIEDRNVVELQNAFKTEGQLQPILCVQLEDGKLGVAAGWNRTEA